MRTVSKRDVFALLAGLGLSPLAARFSYAAPATAERAAQSGKQNTFRVWIFSDAHVGTDKRFGRDSLADPILQSESESGFDWDIAIDLGDLSGAQATPKDEEGEEIIRQFGALKQHRREQIY